MEPRVSVVPNLLASAHSKQDEAMYDAPDEEAAFRTEMCALLRQNHLQLTAHLQDFTRTQGAMLESQHRKVEAFLQCQSPKGSNEKSASSRFWPSALISHTASMVDYRDSEPRATTRSVMQAASTPRVSGAPRTTRYRSSDSGPPMDCVSSIDSIQRRKHSMKLEYDNLTRKRVRSSLVPESVQVVINQSLESRLIQMVLSVFTKRRLRWECLENIVTSSRFDICSALVIIANTVLIGTSSDYEIRSALEEWRGSNFAAIDTVTAMFFYANLVLTCVFTFEILLRWLALECEFWYGRDWQWNVLDFMLVLASVVDVALETSNLQVARSLRLLRLCRTMRIMRSMPVFNKLRTMMIAVMNSMWSLMWAILLLVMMIFIFAVIFIQATYGYMQSGDTDQKTVEFVQTFFPSIPQATLTLFMTISGGVNWWDVQNYLHHVSPAYGILFVFYVCAMTLALLNIVTGIFVNDALETAQMDRDLMTQFETHKREVLVDSLREIFEKLDTTNSGTISREEFISCCKFEDVETLLSIAGFNFMDGLSLFNSLVVDDNNTLEIEEFVMGCVYLLGNAQNVDMKTMMRENKRLIRRLTKETVGIGKKLDSVQDNVRVLALRVDRRNNNARLEETPRAEFSLDSFALTEMVIHPKIVVGEEGSPTSSREQGCWGTDITPEEELPQTVVTHHDPRRSIWEL